MSLLAPAEARGWARMMDEVIHQGRMPPWFADPAVGRFSNEARLSEVEKATLKEWAASGECEKNAPPQGGAFSSIRGIRAAS